MRLCLNDRVGICSSVELDAAKKTEKLETMKTEKLELPSEGNLEVQEDEMSTQEKKLADLNIGMNFQCCVRNSGGYPEKRSHISSS